MVSENADDGKLDRLLATPHTLNVPPPGKRADAAVLVLYYAVLSLPLCLLGSVCLEGDWEVWKLCYEGVGATDYFLLIAVGLAGYGGQWFTNLGLQIETAVRPIH